jgi:protoporphyrinogen oxidase/NAD-dependent dihydropyrimidine dehydrogenase PreA subunit
MKRPSESGKILVNDMCNACGYCYLTCPKKAIKLSLKATIDVKICNLCKKCLFVCPCNAIEISKGNSPFIRKNETESIELKENYDAIIVGAGIGGLLAAAKFSKMGKKIIILEKLSFIGGRFSSISYEGYQITTGAVHMLPYGSKGPFAEILSNLGIELEISSSKLFASFSFKNKYFHKKRAIGLLSLLSISEKINLIKLFIKIKLIKSLDNSISFASWLSEQTNCKTIFSLFESFSNFGLSLSIKDISYNEMRRILKILLLRHVPGVPKGGCENIVKKLKNVIESQNGIIKTKSEVTEIVIKNSNVQGVIVRDRQNDREYFIKSKVIIS